MSERTPFAGLEVLAPGDPLSADNYRFQWTNPSLIDHFLKIGALLHTHDELPGLVNPTTHPELAVAEGGGIPAGQKLYACFTKVDALGGETLASAVHSIETPGAAGPPASAPTAAVDHLAGALLSNTYTYALTVQDGKGGETVLGPATTIFVVPGFAKAEIKLKGLKAIWEAVTTALGSGWRLWRSTNGGPYDLLATGNTDEVVDDGTKEVNCNVEPPEVSTMNGTYQLTVTVPEPTEVPKAEYFRLYLSETETFTSPCFVAQYPVSEYGKAIVLTELKLLPGAPPLLSTSIAHAKKIDPDTSLIEWHWKRPRGKVSELPALGNEPGDVRAIIETGALYVWTGEAWVQVPHLTRTVREHGWAIEGPLSVGSGSGYFVGLAPGETKQITGLTAIIDEGTEATITFKKNGVNIPGLTGIAVTKAVYETTGLTVAVAANDHITMHVVTVVGEPINLTATLFVESKST